jgi:ribosome-binding protein aMBF1 (putative translation factor)
MARERATPPPIGTIHSEEMARKARANKAYREAIEELKPAENLARLIIHKRTELGLSQADLAARMGTTPSVISRLESGQHRITMKTLQRVAAALERHLVVGFAEDDELEALSETTCAPELVSV